MIMERDIVNQTYHPAPLKPVSPHPHYVLPRHEHKGRKDQKKRRKDKEQQGDKVTIKGLKEAKSQKAAQLLIASKAFRIQKIDIKV